MVIYVKGQAPYQLSTLQVPYQPLTNGTSVNGNSVWSVQKFTIPLPFSVKIGNSTVNQVYTDGTVLYADTMGTSVDIFQLAYAYTVDRGYGGANTKSPLSYQVEGNTGSRIFKMQGTSAGFYAEQQNYGTMLDSFDYQIWVYEGSNIVEIHFGNAKISHATDYFQSSGPGFCGYMNVNFSTGSGNSAYLASGDPLNAQPDSLTASHMPAPLNSYPAAGTVYRFTPTSLTANEPFSPTLPIIAYPTQCNEVLNLDYHGQELAHFELLNVQGAAVNVAGELTNGNHQVNLAHLTSGLYFLQISTATATTTMRIVKM